MKAATCAADITPKCAVHLCSCVGEARKYAIKGIHNHPLAVSPSLEIGGVRLLLISIDVITLDREKAAIIKDKVQKILAIENDHIIVSVIHIHPGANGLDDMTVFDVPNNPEYLVYVCEQITNSIRHLGQQLCEVQAYVTTRKVHRYYSKRTDKYPPFEDHAVIITSIHGDTIIAAVCDFNCHATVLGAENMPVNSDLMGKVHSLTKEDLGVTPHTFTGASGDINNRQYRQGNNFAKLDRVRNGIAEILRNIRSCEKLGLYRVRIVSYDHTVSYDSTWYFREHQKGIQGAEEILSHKSTSLDEWKLATSEKTLPEKRLQCGRVEFHVHGVVLHFGDLTIVTFPGELVSIFGLQLRRKRKIKHFLLIGYADDYQGHSMEAQEYGETYETKASNTSVEENERIADETGDLL